MSFTKTETKCLKTENPQTAVNRTKTEKRKFSWHKNRENDLKNSQNRKTDNTNATLLNSFPPLRVASISFILTISSPNNKLTSQEEGKCQCESDLRSNERYLSSSENKALKNSGLYGIWTHDFHDTGAVLFHHLPYSRLYPQFTYMIFI